MLAKINKFTSKQGVGSSLWVVFAFGYAQFVRLAANLILTRLLVPEFFGVMAVINSIIAGVIMLTEIGIRGSIINNEDAAEKYFSSTVWTIQVIRGFTVFILLLLLAPFFEQYFNVEGMSLLMMFVASYPVFRCFSSLGVFFKEKQMDMRRPVMLDMTSQTIGAITMVSLAYTTGSVWSLAFGPVTQAAAFCIFSYLLIPGYTNGFHMNKDAARRVFNYGKWVVLGVGASFIILQSDKIVLAKYITVTQLGVFSVALVYGMFARELMNAVSMKVLFPKFRQLIQANQFAKLNKIRYYTIGVTVLGLIFLTVISDVLIGFLYDERYIEAAWMAQALIILCLIEVFSVTLIPYFLSMKSSFSSMLYQVFKGIIMIPAMIYGVSTGGLEGFMIGLFCSGFIAHVFALCVAARLGNNLLLPDLFLIMISVILLISGWYLADLSALHRYSTMLLGS